MTPDQALQEARDAKLRPIYLVLGEELHLVASVTRALREASVAGGIPGLNEDQMTAGEVTAEQVLSAARTLPMMSARRLVLVRSLERWEGRGEGGKARASSDSLDTLAEYAKTPAESTTLLLTASKLDNRRKLVVLAKSEGWIVQCDPLSRGDLPLYVERSARTRGNPLAPEVADLIAELAGPELAPVTDALERLCLYAGAGQVITADHVADCVVRLRPASVWELVSAVGRRDLGAALSALGQVFDPADRGLRLLSVLAWSARQLLRFDAASRAGLSGPEAAKRAGAAPFKARELADQLKRISRPELESWLELLARVDLALKGGSRRPPRAVLEDAIISLCTRRPAGSGVVAGRPSA
ncbi:MAG TPA: DNA polymerase III subunit delta [Polyangiaceae bacterium]|nr:DNA polymerase III subunit delta [Polyangiaceae bacterium]